MLTDPFQSAAVAAALLADVPLAPASFGVWEPLSDLLEELVQGQAAVTAELGLSGSELAPVISTRTWQGRWRPTGTGTPPG